MPKPTAMGRSVTWRIRATESYPWTRHCIDKAGGALHSSFHPLERSGRRDQKNGGQLVFGSYYAPLLSLTWGQVGGQYARNTDLTGLCREGLWAKLQYRIIAGHNDQWDGATLADLGGAVKDTLDGSTSGQCPLRGGLDSGAIGQRIGVGYAQFNNVRAGLGYCDNELNRFFQARVAGGQIDNKCSPAIPTSVSKGLLDTVHYCVVLLTFSRRL